MNDAPLEWVQLFKMMRNAFSWNNAIKIMTVRIIGVGHLVLAVLNIIFHNIGTPLRTLFRLYSSHFTVKKNKLMDKITFVLRSILHQDWIETGRESILHNNFHSNNNINEVVLVKNTYTFVMRVIFIPLYRCFSNVFGPKPNYPRSFI